MQASVFDTNAIRKGPGDSIPRERQSSLQTDPPHTQEVAETHGFMPYSSAGRRLGRNGTCPHRMPHPALWERGTLPRSEGLGEFLAKCFEAEIAKQLWGASLVSELSPGAAALPIPGWLTHYQVLMASSCGVARGSSCCSLKECEAEN